MIKQTANEPSRGLFFVQQHVHKAVPAIVSLKEQVLGCTEDAELSTEDARDALETLKHMKQVGPPVIERMIKSLNSASETLEEYKSKDHHSVTEATKRFMLQSSPSFKVNSLRSEPTNYARNIWDSALDKANSMSRRSSSVDIKQQGKTAEASDSSSSPYGYVKSVLESAGQRVGWNSESGAAEEKVDSPKSSSEAGVHNPSRYVRAVIDTALMRKKGGSTQKPEEEPEAETETEKVHLRILPTEETYDKFQAESKAKLASWLDEP